MDEDDEKVPGGGTLVIHPRPSQEDTLRPPPRDKGWLQVALGVFIGLMVVLMLALGIVLFRAPPEHAVATGAASSTTTPEAPPIPTSAPTSTMTAKASSSAVVTNTGTLAIAALEKLRGGIEECVTKRIHVLPGTSPAVPESLAWLKKGPYSPLPRDWSSPVFSCAQFKLQHAMPFMIQWQLDKKSSGTGIAWIDEDRDGAAEQAFAFTIERKAKDDLVLGPVERVDPSRKPLRPR